MRHGQSADDASTPMNSRPSGICQANQSTVIGMSTNRICDGYEPFLKQAKDLALIRIATTMGSGHQEARSLQFFLEKTMVQFQTYFPDILWETCILRRANEDSSIRHGLIALSAYHEQFVYRHQQDNPFALRQYNLAIKGLMGSGLRQPHPHISLLSCLIFIYIEVCWPAAVVLLSVPELTRD